MLINPQVISRALKQSQNLRSELTYTRDFPFGKTLREILVGKVPDDVLELYRNQTIKVTEGPFAATYKIRRARDIIYAIQRQANPSATHPAHRLHQEYFFDRQGKIGTIRFTKEGDENTFATLRLNAAGNAIGFISGSASILGLLFPEYSRFFQLETKITLMDERASDDRFTIHRDHPHEAQSIYASFGLLKQNIAYNPIELQQRLYNGSNTPTEQMGPHPQYIPTACTYGTSFFSGQVKDLTDIFPDFQYIFKPDVWVTMTDEDCDGDADLFMISRFQPGQNTPQDRIILGIDDDEYVFWKSDFVIIFVKQTQQIFDFTDNLKTLKRSGEYDE